ncbi:MAG: hypothetical protein ACI857_000645 [Arenicella sp.]|jgi:hypothetical protein
MKRLLFILSILLASATFAQPGQGPNKQQKKKDREERIKAEKIAFITTQLDLNSKEAEKFWPIYNEYEAKIEENRKSHRSQAKKLRNYDELSEDEAYSTTEKLLELEVAGSKIRQEYLVKFAAALGKKKAAKVYHAEERFKRELLKKIKKGNHQGPPHDGPPPGGRY